MEFLKNGDRLSDFTFDVLLNFRFNSLFYIYLSLSTDVDSGENASSSLSNLSFNKYFKRLHLSTLS